MSIDENIKKYDSKKDLEEEDDKSRTLVYRNEELDRLVKKNRTNYSNNY